MVNISCILYYGFKRKSDTKGWANISKDFQVIRPIYHS